jgi:hypothetical protein
LQTAVNIVTICKCNIFLGYTDPVLSVRPSQMRLPPKKSIRFITVFQNVTGVNLTAMVDAVAPVKYFLYLQEFSRKVIVY